MQMNIAEAKARLSELIAAAERGEKVIIARGGVPIVELAPVKPRAFRLGLLEGQVSKDSLPDFLEPMSEAELAEWDA